MSIRRYQVWQLGCDYVDRHGRGCWTSTSERGVSKAVALSRARSAGWGASRRPGGLDLRCPEHRGKHAHPLPWAGVDLEAAAAAIAAAARPELDASEFAAPVPADTPDPGVEMRAPRRPTKKRPHGRPTGRRR